MRAAPSMLALLALTVAAALAQEPADLVDRRCQWCHSDDLVAQQRLSAGQWKTVVERMKTWGAAIDDARVKDVADHLAAAYPQHAPQPAQTLVDASEVDTARDSQGKLKGAVAERGEPVYMTSCASCHGAEARGAKGPALIGRVVLVRLADWREVVLNGRRDMPAFRNKLTPAQAFDVLIWVQGLHQMP